MKHHMIGWKVVSIVLGVLMLLGAAGNVLLGRYSSALYMLLAGVGMFAMSSVCAWMDELLEKLSEGQELQKRQIKGLSMIIEELHGTQGQDEQTNVRGGASGRSGPAREEDSVEPAQNREEPVQYDAQHISDVYRMAQRMDQ